MAPQLMATNGILARGPSSCTRVGQRLLAGAALAQQQHRDVGGGQALDGAADLQHAVAGGDDALDRRGRGRLGEAAVLVFQLVHPQGAFDDGAQQGDVHRLLGEVVGAGADRPQRVHAVAVAGGHDHLHVRHLAGQRLDGGEALADAVRVGRQAEVDDGGRRALLQRQRHPLRAGMRDHQVAARERPAVLAAQALVVLDDQQLRLAHSLSCRARVDDRPMRSRRIAMFSPSGSACACGIAECMETALCHVNSPQDAARWPVRTWRAGG